MGPVVAFGLQFTSHSRRLNGNVPYYRDPGPNPFYVMQNEIR